MITSAICEGGLIGLWVAILIGPVFFLLIQTSIEKGFRKALVLASGIWASDALIIGLTYWGLSQLLSTQVLMWLGILGGLILMGTGLVGLIRTGEGAEQLKSSIAKQANYTYFGKGFIVNVFNPFTIMFWIATVGATSTSAKYQGNEMMFFLISMLLVVLITDTLKAYGASRLKQILTAKRTVLANKIAGALLFLFGVALVIKSLGLDFR